MASPEQIDKMKEALSRHWDELSNVTFDDIGQKYIGDGELFFTAAECLDAMSQESDGYEGDELEAHVKRFMSLLSALVKVAYDHGKEMATQ